MFGPFTVKKLQFINNKLVDDGMKTYLSQI